MSGYAGPDDDALHAMILSENGIRASQAMLEGPILTQCLECGNAINPLRVNAMRKNGMKCIRCVDCQPNYDTRPRVKMLDRIL